jgi:tetratricopeptide (TPR) repeat protein
MRVLPFLLFLFGLAAPAQAAWKEATTRHFQIYSQGSERALSDFAIKIERFDTLLRNRYNVFDVDQPQRLTIFMLPTADAVARSFNGGKTTRDVAGYYSPNATGSIAVVHRQESDEKGALDADAVLFHEYAHHFMLSYFPVAYPAWYIEGFAEFFSTVDFTKAGNAKTGLPAYFRAYGLVNGPRLTAERLFSVTGFELKPDERDVFYGRSWLIVHYLDRVEARAGQMSTYLREINAGKSSLEAAKIAFGDLKLFDKELDKYLNGSLTYATQRKPTPAPTELAIKTLSDALSDLVPLRLKSMRGIRDDKVATLVEESRAYTTKYPVEAEGWYILANAYASAKQDSEASTAVEAALKLNPMLSRALLLKSEILLRKMIVSKSVTPTDWKALRSMIGKANRANVNDPMPLLRYFESWAAEGVDPSPVAYDGIRRAHEMVPESTNVRMAYAFALAKQRKYDEAIKLIEPIAFAPHESSSAAAARSIITRLKDVKAGKSDDINFSDDLE